MFVYLYVDNLFYKQRKKKMLKIDKETAAKRIPIRAVYHFAIATNFGHSPCALRKDTSDTFS